LEEQQIQQLQVELGQVWGNNIEILSDISPRTHIIVSDISNFDASKYTISERTEE